MKQGGKETEWVLASTNPGKLKELTTLLAPMGVILHRQDTLGIAETEEPFLTFIENALTKARHAAQASRMPALADDSGLCVPALGGLPGVLSARYAGEPKSDLRNNQKLLECLAGYVDKHAYYYCVCVFVRHARDPQPIIGEGCWHGEICDVAKGENGFGYDPHFFLPTLGQTAAQLPVEVKNKLSHRAQAVSALLEKISSCNE